MIDYWSLPLALMLGFVLLIIFADERLRRRKEARVAAVVIAIALIPVVWHSVKILASLK